jgi:ribonuclease G
MATDLIINATSFEIRTALIEYGNLVEFHLERPAEKGLVSNIYKGVVKRVLPGMQAAFVDIGLERTGFLYVDDVTIKKMAITARSLVTRMIMGASVVETVDLPILPPAIRPGCQ